VFGHRIQALRHIIMGDLHELLLFIGGEAIAYVTVYIVGVLFVVVEVGEPVGEDSHYDVANVIDLRVWCDVCGIDSHGCETVWLLCLWLLLLL